MPSRNRRLALTIGDPNGIGPEIAVNAAAKLVPAGAEIVLVGDEYIIADYKRRLDVSLSLDICDADALPRDAFQPGCVDPRAGSATVAYVRKAIELHASGRVGGVVACPHSETAINRAGIPFSGYAGLVADLTATPRDRMFLMLVAAGLRIVQVTSHESVQSALNRMSVELVVAAAKTAISALQRLGVDNPSIGVFGINPHAGENGLFGDDDERITKPAVERLVGQGWRVRGPIGADLLLSERKEDLYVAMFHDQAHIPIKLLSPLRASALSIGSPVLFSSVAHGCAHDIAGRGIADPTGVEETLQLMASSYAR
jgi:4-hydroxy-L-threonine phosphate dehydrogenase PdxA